MAEDTRAVADIARSREVAEAAREEGWQGAGFLRDVFLGRLRMGLIHPYPLPGPERPAFTAFYERLERFLREAVDPVAIDEAGEYPAPVLEGLRAMGAFGMKIPVEYGGLGMNQVEYGKVMQLLGGRCGNLTALLSAHQSIGVPQPLKVFGSDLLKQKYLPRIARGAISAFALTETVVGSDPARLTTTAVRSADGSHFVLDGSKLWCTNGTIAELLVVMARDPRTDAISAFVVETGWPGVAVTHRCHFMGLRALANATLQFTGVRVPAENLIGQEGRGLKIALTTLNTGRLSLPAAVVGGAKNALELARTWSAARAQWGQEIGKHEAIAVKLADLAATTFAMEAIGDLAQALADKQGYDIRLEAAAAKEWNTVQAWRLLDETMQVRGGRGYEKASSLEARGEAPLSVERWMRDARINLIFEGSSEIMHLFMAREAVDRHLQVAGALVDPRVPTARKLAALPGVAAFYARWYPGLWLRGLVSPRFGEFGHLARHLRFVERSSRRLARAVFHGMVVFGPTLEKRQAFLFRCVDVANELLAMAASCARAEALRAAARPEAARAVELAGHFCDAAERKVRRLFRALWANDDAAAYRLGRAVLAGDHAWLERGPIPLGVTVEDLRPRLPPHQPADHLRASTAPANVGAEGLGA
ncbi:MAG: acyl-CoA dehydrogenase family protein [Anaeromyxobacter sp.]|nr:acyl-CoA dehydrogenase family protein [Anaeromyxobacter sp.]MBL0276213.1 acyl-CoA dehydrogenase family protein [Anaeromyxobacter sp.]